MRKIILYVLGVLVLCLAGWVSYLLVTKEKVKRPAPVKQVKTVFIDTVRNSAVPIQVKANGNLVAKERVALFAEVQGVFLGSAHPFKPGQSFRRGEVLLRIDASEYQASVQSSKSNLYNLITAAMPDLRLDYPDIYPKWQTYLDSFDVTSRTPELPEMTSEQERYFINGRNIVTTFYNVRNLEQRLTKYIIRAPFSGVLTEAQVTEGTLVRPGQSLGVFINPNVYELEVAVNKSYSDFLQLGKSVVLRNLEGTQNYEGKVSRINAAVNQQSQTVSVFIDVADPGLKEGMYLEATIQGKEEENAIEVPRKLLTEGGELFILRDSILDLAPVTPVFYTDETVILKGLENGTVYLSRSVPGAYPGMLVRPYQENAKQEDLSQNLEN
ncbi:efflux RND transporter periplasmic adaptor subunit [Robiginitalea aurantiaca]|uniref:HlyD family efflux transporter periplasmic adaptor subunit n=1 Tax=Robiginitalea aurantiaca TaxID=3056915 RepID=A0ABT7WF48_9FLAO|nr:HlyD family efflux transporter periplasmic adaptor subunit [Robiginitalea aurantiaca]MDM9631548.1 HlyD family efflux transporter periplasmic adaptor subunit [Robiginitalea aurantiaca]